MVAEASFVVTFILEGLTSFLLIALLYYALRILTSFKKGLLERGWRILSVGIILLVAGVLIMTLSNYITVGGYLYQLGIGINAIGVCLAVMGFKSHYDVWAIGKEDNSKVAPKIEST